MTSTVVHGEGRWELQYASDHFSLLLQSRLHIFFCFPRLYVNLSLTFSSFLCPNSFYSLSSPPPFFVFPRRCFHPGTGTVGGPTELGPRQMAAVPVVCERSVLSKQTHWAICFSTLHQAGCSEESAHHFNQPPPPAAGAHNEFVMASESKARG